MEQKIAGRIFSLAMKFAQREEPLVPEEHLGIVNDFWAWMDSNVDLVASPRLLRGGDVELKCNYISFIETCAKERGVEASAIVNILGEQIDGIGVTGKGVMALEFKHKFVLIKVLLPPADAPIPRAR